MKFLADMGISQSTVAFMRKKGYDAVHLREQGLHTMQDSDILQKAAEENRVILTCDLEFGSLMAACGKQCPSVILFRLENETPENVNRRLAQVLEECSSALQQGSIVLVEETRHRIRMLPITK